MLPPALSIRSCEADLVIYVRKHNNSGHFLIPFISRPF
jgi:hypothetical protein